MGLAEELNSELNMDGQPQQREETENNDMPEQEIAKQVCPSILERLLQPRTCPIMKKGTTKMEAR